MLTRLEVQGFKNLLDLQVEFGPFTCIAGENGVGKSNLFDAIEFLTHLASDSMLEAAQRFRGVSGERIGDPRDLFWDGYRNRNRRMRFAAEMIVPRQVEDDLGVNATATSTFLRYELELGYVEPQGRGDVGRLALLAERLKHINKGEAHRHLAFDYDARRFRDSIVVNERTGGPFLSTEVRDGAAVVYMHGDGGSRGKPQPRPAAKAGRTVLSTVTTTDYPTILAARREMQSWRRLALEPSALRTPNRFVDSRELGVDGRHLAACLYRIANDPSVNHGDETRVYGRIASRLADLGLRVEVLDVEVDEVHEVFTVFLRERGGLRLPARALSEGALRFLALCVLLEDPTVTGLICMEEPENGVHPANLESMVELVRDLAVDAQSAPGPDNPFRQIMVNTHSPGVVQLCDEEDLLLARTAWFGSAGDSRAGLVLEPFEGTRRAERTARAVNKADLLAYLTAQPHAQLTLNLAG